MNYSIKLFQGESLCAFIDDLAQLRINIFRDYPYLYNGDFNSEREYLGRYLKPSNSLISIAFAEGQIIGAGTGIPLKDECGAFLKPFQENNINFEKYFYVGEVLIEKAHRGKLGVKVLKTLEEYALQNGFEYCCFATIMRPSDHPAKPANYRPLDNLLLKLGYEMQNNLIANLSWLDVGAAEKTVKPMLFWRKKLISN